MELHLGGARVDHRRRPDGHHRPVGVELARRHHLVVLLDAHVEGHVRRLGPATERREPQHGVLVPLGHQPLARVLHQEGVTGVRRVARLEGVDDVGALASERRLELVDSEAVLVKAVVVLDAAEQLDLAAEAVRLARREHVLDVRVVVVVRAPSAVDDLARAVLVQLGRAQDGKRLAGGAGERHRGGLADLAAREVGDRQDDRHRHRDALLGELGLHPVGGLPLEVPLHARVVVRVREHRVEPELLDEVALAHEALERRRPPLADHLQPVDVVVGQRHLGERRRLRELRRQLVGGHDQVDGHAAVGGVQPALDLLAHEDAARLERAHQRLHRLRDRQVVRLERHLRLERRLVRRVDAGEALDQALRDLGVQPLRVARLDNVERHVEEHLEERQPAPLVHRARRVAVLAVRRDERDDRDHARLVEEGGDVGGAAHALAAVVGREAEVARQPGAQVVAVDVEDVLAVDEEQLLLERLADGRLAGARQTRHPQRRALLPEHLVPLLAEAARLVVRVRRALDDVLERPRQHLLPVGRHHVGVLCSCRARRRGAHGGRRRHRGRAAELALGARRLRLADRALADRLLHRARDRAAHVRSGRHRRAHWAVGGSGRGDRLGVGARAEAREDDGRDEHARHEREEH